MVITNHQSSREHSWYTWIDVSCVFIHWDVPRSCQQLLSRYVLPPRRRIKLPMLHSLEVLVLSAPIWMNSFKMPHQRKDASISAWRRKRQPTPVFLPGKLHGRRNLVGYCSWGHKELDMTEQHRNRTEINDLLNTNVMSLLKIWVWTERDEASTRGPTRYRAQKAITVTFCSRGLLGREKPWVCVCSQGV